MWKLCHDEKEFRIHRRRASFGNRTWSETHGALPSPAPALLQLGAAAATRISPNTRSQSRVNLPDHVLGHPCLYYPNFISNDVAAQVKLAAASAPVSANTPLPLLVGRRYEAKENVPNKCC